MPAFSFYYNLTWRRRPPRATSSRVRRRLRSLGLADVFSLVGRRVCMVNIAKSRWESTDRTGDSPFPAARGSALTAEERRFKLLRNPVRNRDIAASTPRHPSGFSENSHVGDTEGKNTLKYKE
jgi:hypothetical protein